MVQFLSIIFFSWISSIFVGFFKSSRFFVSPRMCVCVCVCVCVWDFANFNDNVNVIEVWEMIGQYNAIIKPIHRSLTNTSNSLDAIKSVLPIRWFNKL